MGAARRAREKAARRETILDAAADCLADGARALTMEAVASEAEVSKGTVYLYFANKDALLAALAERNIRQLLPRMHGVMAGEGTGLDKALAIFDAYVDFFRTHTNVFRHMIDWLAQANVDDSSEDFQAYRARIAEALQVTVVALETGKRDGTVRAEIDSVHRALHMWSSSLGVLLLNLNALAMGKRLALPVELGRLFPIQREVLRTSLQAT